MCEHNDKRYDEGATICIGGKCMQCQEGKWVDTGTKCEPAHDDGTPCKP